MFTAKLYKYKTGYQVRVYRAPVIEKSKGDFYPGETEKKELWYNPFTGRREYVPDMPDEGRSAQASLNRTRNNVYYLTRSNHFDWFVTLTFDPQKVDSYNYDECVDKLSNWLSNCRKTCPDMRYIVVPEQHKSGRWHFHGLFADCDGLNMVDGGHRAHGDVIYNIGSYKLGWTTATRVKDAARVSRYLVKYITKSLCMASFGRRRYWASRNLEKAEIKPVIIAGGRRNEYMEYLLAHAGYSKTCSSVYNEVTYYELDAFVEVDDDYLDSGGAVSCCS